MQVQQGGVDDETDEFFAYTAAMMVCGWMTDVQAGVVAYYDFAGSGTNDASGTDTRSFPPAVWCSRTARRCSMDRPLLSSDRC
jgi:hypothetical protein